MRDYYEVLPYASKRLEFVNSGATASSISCALRAWDETLISSVAAASSGDGHYYSVVTHPGSNQWVINEWIAVFNGSEYRLRQFGRVHLPNVSQHP